MAVVGLLLSGAGPVLASGPWLAGGGGAVEPSTAYDTPAVMFQDANTDLDPVTGKGFDKLYLNGYLLHSAGLGVSVQYDGNLDGGRMYGPGGAFAVAVMGFWRDCNGDGYVGSKTSPSAYGSFSTYLVQATVTPIDTDVCPVGSPYYPINPYTGEPNNIIDEFRWVGDDAGCDEWETQGSCPARHGSPNPLCIPPNQAPPTNTGICPAVNTVISPGSHNDVTDNESRVWADWGYPGHPHVPHGPLRPLPRDTFSHPHGTLKFVDDATIGLLSGTIDGWPLIPNVGACDQPHPVFLGGPSGTCGTYPLWQARRVVNDTTCEAEDPSRGRPAGCSEPDPLVTTWDLENDDNGSGTPCDDGFSQDVTRPDDNSYLLRVRLPDLEPGVNPNILADGSLSGTYEHQQRGTNGTRTGGGSAPTQCGSDGGIADLLEIDDEDTMFRHSAPTMVLNFTDGQRYQHGSALGFYDVPRDEWGNGGGGPGGLVFVTEGWYSNVVWSGRPPRSLWGSAETTWTTFYADVTPFAFERSGADPAQALPSGGQDKHIYGVEYCADGIRDTPGGGSFMDPTTSWECNADEWRIVRERFPTDNREHWAPAIGTTYDLRDVDCYDNTVSDRNMLTGDALTGLRAGIADCAVA